MHTHINIFGLNIPSYGLLIAMGAIIANVVALFMVKRLKRDVNDFILVEAYCLMGAFIGSKLLYLIVSYKEIDWSRIGDLSYFNTIMSSGFVFYGGLIGAILLAYFMCKLHKINAFSYIRTFIFLLPFAHAFGRVGCFMAGCCYGIPYNGFGAVVYPRGGIAPSGIRILPIQLIEAVFLMVIALTIIILQVKRELFYTVELYLILYGVLRFILEYFRYDEIRGNYGVFSTSQWISVAMVIIGVASVIIHNNRYKRKVA